MNTNRALLATMQFWSYYIMSTYIGCSGKETTVLYTHSIEAEEALASLLFADL